jgi:hypothetical protein
LSVGVVEALCGHHQIDAVTTCSPSFKSSCSRDIDQSAGDIERRIQNQVNATIAIGENRVAQADIRIE